MRISKLIFPLFYTLLFFACSTVPKQNISAQKNAPTNISPTEKTDSLPRPKLVIGIVVDQMRYDFLYKYWDLYSDKGFKRLVREGFSCENTHYNYMPTYTAPGHAAIYTGTTPSVNGIIANDWFDRDSNFRKYVTIDSAFQTVGEKSIFGKHSPKVLISSTITDELGLSNAFQSKVVSICLKDRGAILPAGHRPTACYWFSDLNGDWITSSYYEKDLPVWVKNFNAKDLPQAYLKNEWKTLRPESEYDFTPKNWAKYESFFKGDATGNFPYNLSKLSEKEGVGLIRFTPWGSVITTDFALDALKNHNLGKGEYTDFLCLSYSSTDYCGHNFGVHAKETADTYIRLDLELARLFEYFDKNFDKNEVLIFLTADHGVAETPDYLKEVGIPAGVFPQGEMNGRIKKVLKNITGKKKEEFVLDFYNQQIYLNHNALKNNNLSIEKTRDYISNYLQMMPETGNFTLLTKAELMALPPEYPFISTLRNGVHPYRSGDLFLLLEPAWHDADGGLKHVGTTHGSPYPYDTHVPLLFYGFEIPQGKTYKRVNITDIAPTLAAKLRIIEPNGCVGRVIFE